MPKFTATEQRILDVLSDGLSHVRQELKDVLEDELAGKDALSFHMMNIRRKLEPIGQSVVCELRGRKVLYRHVILLRSLND